MTQFSNSRSTLVSSTLNAQCFLSQAWSIDSCFDFNTVPGLLVGQDRLHNDGISTRLTAACPCSPRSRLLQMDLSWFRKLKTHPSVPLDNNEANYSHVLLWLIGEQSYLHGF